MRIAHLHLKLLSKLRLELLEKLFCGYVIGSLLLSIGGKLDVDVLIRIAIIDYEYEGTWSDIKRSCVLALTSSGFRTDH